MEKVTKMDENVLKRADLMLKYFKKAQPGIYPVAPSQVELIKEICTSLHQYTGAEFTFNESYNKVKKHDITRIKNI